MSFEGDEAADLHATALARGGLIEPGVVEFLADRGPRDQAGLDRAFA
ncbi:hypothetical protein [Kibdelosporangium aridum]|nr:hypothetical protein [Kibdelosporangium aridum]